MVKFQKSTVGTASIGTARSAESIEAESRGLCAAVVMQVVHAADSMAAEVAMPAVLEVPVRHGPWETWLAAWVARWRLRSCESELGGCARRHQVACMGLVHDVWSAEVVQPSGSFGLANRRRPEEARGSVVQSGMLDRAWRAAREVEWELC